MSFLGEVDCGKQSVLTKETLGHNLQLPEGNTKSARKDKGLETKENVSVHLSAAEEGVTSCSTHFLGLSLQTRA